MYNTDLQNYDLHAIPCCQVSVYNFIAAQIFHSSGNLPAKVGQLSRSTDLKETTSRSDHTSLLSSCHLGPLAMLEITVNTAMGFFEKGNQLLTPPPN